MSVRSSRRKHLRLAAIGGGLRPPSVLSTALIHCKGDDLAVDGSGDVISWPNQGVNGSDYDLDTVAGDKANSSVGDINGNPALLSVGGYGLRTSGSPSVIEAPYTLVYVGRFDSDPISGFESMFGNLGGTATQFYADSGGGGRWGVYRGALLNLAAAYDNETRIHTVEAGEVTTGYTVSGKDTTSGNAGVNDLQLGSVMINGVSTGSESVVGALAEFAIFAGAVSSEDLTELWTYFATKYGLTL